jgi:ribonuclease HI
MVGSRLYWYLERHNCLSTAQSGFRRGQNTTDQVARLEKIIRETYLEKGVSVAVFIDLKGAYDTVNHRILLNKLLSMGVKGKLLRYCSEFLKNRQFRVMHNGELSDTKNINVGLPQGASISPMLFNVLISDIPEIDGVIRTEYADDIALIAKSNSIQESTNKIQQALNSFYDYTKINKLEINDQKTIAMLFTRKNVAPLQININQYNINYVKEFKFLGVTLDGRYLDWKAHISKTKTDCIKRINIMKAVAHKDWGADRVMLLRIYKALVLSKLNYGREFYSTASNTALQSLNIIQNTALRIATGARQTSPICSLEVECNILPLQLQKSKIVLDYYNRFRNIPNTLKVVTDLTENLHQQVRCNWTDTTPPPLIIRAKKIIMDHQLSVIDTTPLSLVNTRPPWQTVPEIQEFMADEQYIKTLPESIIQNIFKDRCNELNGYLQIYTDGSKITQPISATAAAMTIPDRNVTHKWKLPSQISILTAELFAIFMALEWVVASELEEKCVVFTDSLSSIKLLKNNKGKKQNVYKQKIQNQLETIKQQGRTVTICWIPSHKGITGNELVDVAAKDATTGNIITLPYLTKLDMKGIIKSILDNTWKTSWDEQSNLVNIGAHIRKIRTAIGYWPWTSIPSNRRLETIMARLRIGHTGLNAYLYRFGLHWSPLCDCGLRETVEHYLLDCPLTDNHRRELVTSLATINVQLNIKNILGGGNFNLRTQKKIVIHMGKYFTDTGKVGSL